MKCVAYFSGGQAQISFLEMLNVFLPVVAKRRSRISGPSMSGRSYWVVNPPEADRLPPLKVRDLRLDLELRLNIKKI